MSVADKGTHFTIVTCFHAFTCASNVRIIFASITPALVDVFIKLIEAAIESIPLSVDKVAFTK